MNHRAEGTLEWAPVVPTRAGAAAPQRPVPPADEAPSLVPWLRKCQGLHGAPGGLPVRVPLHEPVPHEGRGWSHRRFTDSASLFSLLSVCFGSFWMSSGACVSSTEAQTVSHHTGGRSAWPGHTWPVNGGHSAGRPPSGQTQLTAAAARSWGSLL